MSEQNVTTSSSGTENPRPATTYYKTAADKAKDAINGCWIMGVVLLLAGGGIAGASLPSFDSVYADSGSTGGLLFGMLLIGVGQIVVLVGVIATGVRLGVNSSAQNQG